MEKVLFIYHKKQATNQKILRGKDSFEVVSAIYLLILCLKNYQIDLILKLQDLKKVVTKTQKLKNLDLLCCS